MIEDFIPMTPDRRAHVLGVFVRLLQALGTSDAS